MLAPFAVAYLVWLAATSGSTFTGHGAAHSALLASTGIVTAVPLLLFALAAKTIPLSTIGMIQYLTPTVQMIWAVAVKHEQLSSVRWAGFVIIWVAVAIYVVDTLRTAWLKRRRVRP